MQSLKEGDVWFRVSEHFIDDGSETYVGVELVRQRWTAVKVTPKGAWFRRNQFSKDKFALREGARWISPTEAEALERFIARKHRQISILRNQLRVAEDALDAAMLETF